MLNLNGTTYINEGWIKKNNWQEVTKNKLINKILVFNSSKHLGRLLVILTMLTQVSRDKVQHTNEHTYFFYGHRAYFWRQPPVVIKLVLLCYLVSGLVSNWWDSVEVIALLFCLQAFSDEFQKTFPSASSGSPSSTQSKGRQHCLICSCYIMLPNKTIQTKQKMDVFLPVFKEM